MSIDAQQLREIAARAARHEQTVRKAYKGGKVQPVSWRSIARAARELGYPEPPPRFVAPEREARP